MTAKKPQNIRPAPQVGSELAPREKIIGPTGFFRVAGGEGLPGDEGQGGDEASDLGKIEIDDVLEEDEGGDGRVTEVTIGADGKLQPDAAEAILLVMADGFSGSGEINRVAGVKNAAHARRLRRHPVFQARLAMLLQEKAKLSETGMSGEMVWAAKQNWRVARQSGDVQALQRATGLLFDVTKTLMGVSGEGEVPALPAPGEARGPGRPAHQPRATKLDVDGMRRQLLSMGKPAPDKVQ